MRLDPERWEAAEFLALVVVCGVLAIAIAWGLIALIALAALVWP